MTAPEFPSPVRSWRDSLRAFADRRIIALLFLGFSAGLPLLLVFSTLSLWLAQADVSRSTIGFMSWAALSYGFKFVWAPMIDRFPVPGLTRKLGRRRAWLLIAQVTIMAALVLTALNDPKNNLFMTAVFAVLLGFASATQDVVIDAYRIEVAEKDLQGLMSAAYIAGYRVGMAVAGAGALEIAGFLSGGRSYDYHAWSVTYLAMAAVMLVGVGTTFAVPEPDVPHRPEDGTESRQDYQRFLIGFLLAVGVFVGVFLATSAFGSTAREVLASSGGLSQGLSGFIVESLRFVLAAAAAFGVARALVGLRIVPEKMLDETYIAPFRDFFQRYGRTALFMLGLIATYRIADIVMGVMANVFYSDIGFSLQAIGRVTKIYGVIMTIVGSVGGGILILRFGLMRTLFAGAALAAGTNLLFVLLAQAGPDLPLLMVVISADNLSGGIAAAAFVAYLSSLTSASFTASQYAIFSSVMLLLPKVMAGYSGSVVESVGYPAFFTGTALLGVPVLILIVLLARRDRGKP